jgi:tetratricopeptide (TPR) repeat protein
VTALTTMGYDALRRGDYTSAADQFQQVLRASPRQSAAATGLAYAELWRSDPRQAAHRSDVLRRSPPPVYPADAAEHFRDGIARMERRDLVGAERALSAVVTAAPSWAEAYYNRALVLQAEDQPERAMTDLQRYLQLRPTASDSGDVARRITVLSRTPVDALTRGLIAPGLGQFYTGRPALGAAILAGVIGSTAFALSQQTTTETRIFHDAFGAPYPDKVTVSKRPHLAAGLAAAGAIWLVGAMEASLHVANAKGGVPLPSGPGRAAGTAARLQLQPLVSLEPTGPAFGAAAVVRFR